MQLLSAQQLHDWDAYTIRKQRIESIELMERAAEQCADFLMEDRLPGTCFKIFCGKGNNGGDGLAIARMLLEEEAVVDVYIMEFGAKGTSDFQQNLQRLHEISSHIHFIQGTGFFPEIQQDDIVVDALYGSGLNRPLEGLSAALVAHINSSGAEIVSIDVPSGMFIDKSCLGLPVVCATHTLTFQVYKLCFLVAENAKFFGAVTVLNIELEEHFIPNGVSELHFLTHSHVSNIFKPRPPFAHKGNFGHVLMIAGNTGKAGAALLATKACLRAGAGLVTTNIPDNCVTALNAYIPEAMTAKRDGLFSPEDKSVVAIGPGIGTGQGETNLVQQLTRACKKPMVIDADAITILAQNKEWLALLGADTVLTPHPKEFERLFGTVTNDFGRIQLALEKSREFPFVIVLKGHYTLVAANGKGWFNTTGNAGLAKGGSGDVLTGIIAALLAQQYAPLDAALLGMYLHGLAADLALESQAKESLLASDLVEYFGRAFYKIAQPQGFDD